MKIKGVVINEERDNVAVVSENVSPGDEVIIEKQGNIQTIKALEQIPIYHKICISALKKGDVVLKYGESIGRVTEDVPAGGYIHIHNLGGLGE